MLSEPSDSAHSWQARASCELADVIDQVHGLEGPASTMTARDRRGY
jgi:hypothetical protein